MITYEGNKIILSKASALINKLFDSKDNEKIILLRTEPFIYSNIGKEKIADIMNTFFSNNLVSLFEYKTPWWKKSNVLAYTINEKAIFINTRNINRSLASICGTLAHELAHCADNWAADYTFGHGNNSPNNKGSTFPYWFGNEVKKYIEHQLK